MAKLAVPTQCLIDEYHEATAAAARIKRGDAIHVDEVASKVAGVYEKIRSIIDYGDEHTLRKRAIKRILTKRLLVIQDRDKVAQLLVTELVRNGYLKNDAVERATVARVARALRRQLFLTQRLSEDKDIGLRERERLSQWLFNITVAEVEDLLDDDIAKKSLITFAVRSMTDRIVIKQGAIARRAFTEEDKRIQTAIAVRRTIFRLDDYTIAQRLIADAYPEWHSENLNIWEQLAADIPAVYTGIEEILRHRLRRKFTAACKKQRIFFLLLGDLLAEDPEKTLANVDDSAWLGREIRKAYKARVLKMRRELGRIAIYTTLSIFLTKMMLAVSIEMPLERFFIGEFDQVALAVNVAMPPILMLLLILTARPATGGKGREAMWGVARLVYAEKDPQPVYIESRDRTRGLFKVFVALFYVVSFAISFGLMWFVLDYFGMNPFSIAVFIFFFSLISFAGVSIRQRAVDLNIRRGGGGFFSLLFGSLALPFVKVGQIVSDRLSKHNLFLFFDIFIELPFTVFVEFLEHWRTFLQEKQDEIR